MTIKVGFKSVTNCHSSFKLSGCNTKIVFSSANFLIGLACNSPLLPTGRSGCVTTALTL